MALLNHLPYLKPCSFSTFNYFLNSQVHPPCLVGYEWFLQLVCLRFQNWFSSRFFKSSFHFWYVSSWSAAFEFDLEALFLPLTSFTVYHANWDGLSSGFSDFEMQGTINLSSCSSEGYASVFLGDSDVTFHLEGKNATFRQFLSGILKASFLKIWL